MKRMLDRISGYVEAHTLYASTLTAAGQPADVARSETERAIYAAHMAHQKGPELLEKESGSEKKSPRG